MQHRRILPFVAVACIALGACAGGGDRDNAATTDQSAAGSVSGTGTTTDSMGRDSMRDSMRDSTRDTTNRTGTGTGTGTGGSTTRPRNP